MPDTKIATCCYCQRRTTLRNDGHTLMCGSCGAPLTRMKALRPTAARAAAGHAPVKHPVPLKDAKTRRKTPKKRKSLWQKVASEIWDEIEDIFD
ncbi:hypothetical protein [Jannaschia sp. M317]|uniref:hypothetical protein n=1 Tax=Jannaschia sp. M317 TaxID=2867011 RepID=UPI0021A780F2|nr:hypothetical protein [Jannaschia sp. M317]UWQ19308.1 hypothetical protein K3551_08610 [Jannaschia sp. M317]